MGENDGVIAANSAPIKHWCAAEDTLGHTQQFMFCDFGAVHLSAIQGQEKEAVLNAANAVVIESVVQLILRSLSSVTCVHTNMHMKTEMNLNYCMPLVTFKE